MPVGWLIQLARGIKDTWDVSVAESQLEDECKKVSDLDNIFADMHGLDLVVAQNEMIIAEYMVKRSRLPGKIDRVRLERLWAKVKETMDAKLAAVENELRNQPATKLDVARILTALSKMAGETDKELSLIQNDISSHREFIRKVSELESRLNEQRSETGKQAAIILKLQESIGREMERLEGRSAEHEVAIASLKDMATEEIVKLKEKLTREVGNLEDKLTGEVGNLEKKLTDKVEKLEMRSAAHEMVLKAMESKLAGDIEKLETRVVNLVNELGSISQNVNALNKLFVDEIRRLETLITTYEQQVNEHINNSRLWIKTLIIPLYLLTILNLIGLLVQILAN